MSNNDICPCFLDEVIKTIQPDTIALFKRITGSPCNWFIYGFQNFKHESVRGFIIHKFHDKFTDDVLFKAFETMMDRFTHTDFNILEEL